MKLRELDPVRDPRWTTLLQANADSSVFHTREWLRTLERTYGYRPVAFTDAADGQPVGNALLFCRVSSWMTGRRLVSLPFSDHCEPLLEAPDVLRPMLDALRGLLGREGRYIEIRPRRETELSEPYGESSRFWWHAIDLRPGLDELLAGVHKSHVRRAIKKAARLGVAIEAGRSETQLAEFYRLHVLTRQRHGVPVQPAEWFRNLASEFGDRLSVYMARSEGRPIAAILTIAHKRTLVYKYGCSDPAFNRLAATPALFWRAIEDGKAQGAVEFDLGRSDIDNPGLVAFKEHLGARRSMLTYYRCTQTAGGAHTQYGGPAIRQVFRCVPRPIQARIGNALYRHFG